MAIRPTRLALSLLCVVMTIGTASRGGGNSDEATLLAFKAGHSSSVLASWNSSASFCNWEGVTCGRRRPTRVVALDLRSSNLTGTLTPVVGNLTFLRWLNLSSNGLYGEIPPSLGRLRHLRSLDLGSNSLSVIPYSLFNLTSLKYVYLFRNRFSGFVPSTVGRLRFVERLGLYSNRLEADKSKGWEFITSLANCSQLQYLDIAYNSFSGKLPRSIVNLSTTLQELYVDHNSISGSMPEEIGNLIGLDMLDLGFTNLSGVIPTSIGKLANLVEIGLHYTSLSGLIPSSIGNLTNLNRLYAFYSNFEGPIPASLGELKKLFVLGLSNNHLNGSIPREIFELPSLSWFLDLSSNSLSGPIPSEVGTLVNINAVDLSGNQLSGQIPDSIGNCIVLESLYLEENSFEGGIPQSLSNLKGLTILNLTMNKFSGKIPDTIGSIQQLQKLSLAHNNFSGPIPASLQNLTTLWQLDVSFNNLQGEVPVKGVFRNLTFSSVVGNDNLCGGIPQLHLPPCPILDVRKNKNQHLKSLAIALPTTGAMLVLVSVIVLILLHHRKLKRRQNRQATSLVIEEQYQRVSYYVLSRGSNDFSEANLLGKGRYGSVYRCTLDNEDALVAVKVFDLQQLGSSKSFEAECEALRRVRHRSLIKIITCCSSIDPRGQEFKALVLEFMPNGSLDGWIHPKSSKCSPSNTLSFSQRLNIVIDIFEAMDYLHNHCQPSIIHCDMKPSNILLAEDMSAKVGDFGISKILPKSTTKTHLNSKSSIGIRGSIGYIAPEYGEGSAASKLGDIYSLGIMLLEMFTATSPTDDMFKDSLNLHDFAAAAFPDRALEIADETIWLHETNYTDVTDASMTRGIIQQSLVSVFGLGISCSKQQPRERMVLADAVSKIHAIRDEYFKSQMVEQRAIEH
uniref:Receptor kinase-like protein Xa21 n=1 Tax=Oryza punctata TaxID=4537 RepID=A0A0E0JE55_ORYPU